MLRVIVVDQNSSFNLSFLPQYLPRSNALAIELKPETDLRLFVHSPGDEFWLHLDYWQEPSLNIKIDKTSFIIDVSVSKIITTKYEKCKEDKNYKEMGKFCITVILIIIIITSALS